MRNIKAVFNKQLVSYIYNPERWGAPAAFLLIPFIFMIASPDANMALLTIQFVIMFVGISMIGGTAAIIREDRETKNLRFMGMAGVKPYQYLISTCSVLLLVSFGVLLLFGFIAGHYGGVLVNFMIITMLGVACSMLLGMTFGLSKLAPFTWIIGILLGVGPVMAADAGIEVLSQVFYFTHTYQINVALRGGSMELPNFTTLYELYENYNIVDIYGMIELIREMRTPTELVTLPMSSVRIMIANMGVMLLAFIGINLRYGLDGERAR